LISTIPTLSSLIASLGWRVKDDNDDKNEFDSPIVREVKHPVASMLTEENLNEKILTDVIADVLQKENEKLWFKSQVNLWDFVEKSREPLEVFRRYLNPLQPDIDLLYCHNIDGRLQSPIVGTELKVFSKRTGYGKVIPKTTSWVGYYAGLDEAIALLSFGLDYVYLMQLFIFPAQRLFNFQDKYGDDFALKITGSNLDYIYSCSAFLKALIQSSEIPIGYVPSLLFIDRENESF